MIITGQSLISLAKQHSIVENPEILTDGFSLELSLSRNVTYVTGTAKNIVRYRDAIPKKLLNPIVIEEGGSLVLKPKSAVLACSKETIFIPPGYFGFIQTKGTLARHFVSVACFDGQVDPGFNGCITFELVSSALYTLEIPESSPVARLFIMKTHYGSDLKYEGRYSGFNIPTPPSSF